ncbi:MAG: hypothetical protein ACYCXG_06675 [Acidiferrobacter sp.]
MIKTLRHALALWFLATAPCYAFLGVGDITFDPAVHAELIAVTQQLLALYHTTMAQVERMRAMEQTLRQAQADTRTIVNGSFAHYAAGVDVLPIPPALMRALRTTDPSATAGHRLISYYDDQMQRLHALSGLQTLRHGVQRNIGRAATAIGEKTSGQITAQSTTALAALAVRQARRAEQRAVRHAAARHNDARLPRQARALYRTLGAL